MIVFEILRNATTVVVSDWSFKNEDVTVFRTIKNSMGKKGLLDELILHDITMNMKCIGAKWQAHTGLI